MGDRTTLGAGAVYCGVFPLLLYTAYATFYMRQDVMPALPLAAFCLSMAVIHGGNALLLRRGPTLPMLVGLNGVLCGGALVLILTLSRFYGAGQVFFALCLIAAGCVISIYTAFSLISIPKLLTQCDVLTLATVWMCLLEASGAIPVTTLFYYLAALLLVLASLLALRTFGGTRDVVYGSRLQGAALSIGLLALIGGSLYLFVHFLSGASRAAVTALLHTIGAFFAAAGRLLNQFVQWLAQFWTPSEMEVSPRPQTLWAAALLQRI